MRRRILPLIGRRSELEMLTARWTDACAGKGQVAILRGESGIGKSRLATEAMQLARHQQFAVVRARVIEGDWQPEYQCWIDILTSAVEWLPGSINARQIPDWAPPLAPLVAPIAQRFPGVPAFGVNMGASYDWLIAGSDGVGRVDVRATMRTHDDVLVHYEARGIIKIPADGLERLAAGEVLPFGDTYVRTTPMFETADERYGWLSGLVAVGYNVLSSNHIDYRIYRVL